MESLWSFSLQHPEVMMVGRQGGRQNGSKRCPTIGCLVCVGVRLGLVCWRKKAKHLSEGIVLLLIYCVPVEKGSLAGFLSAFVNKSLLSKTFTALNVKISIAAHAPKVSEGCGRLVPT